MRCFLERGAVGERERFVSCLKVKAIEFRLRCLWVNGLRVVVCLPLNVSTVITIDRAHPLVNETLEKSLSGSTTNNIFR